MSVAEIFPEVAKNDEALDLLETLARVYAESVDDLKTRWDFYAFRHGNPQLTDVGALDAFQKFLVDQNRSNVAKKPKIMTPKGLRGGIMPKISIRDINHRKFKVNRIAGYNDKNLSHFTSHESAVPRLQNNTNLEEYISSRPFNESLRGLSSALDQQIESVVSLVTTHFGWSRNEVVNPHNISQVDSIVVGRICRMEMQSKSLKDAQREWYQPLKTGNMVIESSKRIGGGSRTPLDFSLLDPNDLDGLFEGAIVALRGKNPKGDIFITSKIIQLPPLGIPIRPYTESSPLRVLISRSSQLDNVFCWIKMCKAQGEFANVPSAIIAMGSFSQEPSGVTRLINDFETEGILIIHCPSLDDRVGNVPVFPQAPTKLPVVNNMFIRMSNPCTFSLNEVAFTVSTAPILEHLPLKSNEVKFEQILRQRQIYPLFPAHKDFNFSVDKYKLSAFIDSWPNILMLPSPNWFCGAINDVLCVGITENIAMLTVMPGTKPLNQRISVQTLELEII